MCIFTFSNNTFMIKYLDDYIELEGISGNFYQFELYSFNIDDFSDLNSLFEEDDCGVYIFTKQNKYGKYDLIYCGESTDLSTRFYKHHREDCILRKKADYFGIFYCDRTETKDIEKDILDKYDFLCNTLNN